MRKSLTVFSTTLLFILVIVGCKEECVSSKGIYGDWLWTRTYDNHYGITTTPEGLGYTEKLRINDFIFKQYINDSLVYESQYDLVTRTDSVNIEKNYIVFPSGHEQRIYVEESQLILTETILLINPSSFYTRI